MAIIRVTSNPSDFVYVSGDQTINGTKDFQTRPTVTDVPVLISGDLAEIKNFSIAMAIALS